MRRLSIAAVLAILGFLIAVGLMDFFFSSSDGFSPKSSADAASWIQALGSIGAIIGAFLMGERQARRERDRADDARDKEEQDRQEAQLAVIKLLCDFGERFERAYSNADPVLLRMEWDTALKNNVRAALNAFDAMPLHEMKSSARVLAAAEVRSAVQSMYDITASTMNGMITANDQELEEAFQNAKSECDIHFVALAVAWLDVTGLWPRRDP